MIANRPSNLWLGAATALFNVVVLLLRSSGIEVPGELVVSVNIAFAALITLVAGQPPVVNTDSRVIVKTNNGHTDKSITFNEAGFAVTTAIPGTSHTSNDKEM